MDPDAVAEEMLAACIAEGQSARRVPDDGEAERVRARLREAAGVRGLRIRTARMADAVVVARLDAAVWRDDAATMRRKLDPDGP